MNGFGGEPEKDVFWKLNNCTKKNNAETSCGLVELESLYIKQFYLTYKLSFVKLYFVSFPIM